MVQQVTLRWTAAGSAGGVSVLNFSDESTPAEIFARVDAFANAIDGSLASTTNLTADPEIRVLDTASGTLMGFETMDGVVNYNGTGGTSAVPNAAQGLIRFNTGAVVAGRVLRGRLFIPGMSVTAQGADGHVSSSGLAALNAAGTALDLSGNLQVWHRPVDGVGGDAHAVNTTSAWTEFAVLRRRRT
jgi:hypothetical protein